MRLLFGFVVLLFWTGPVFSYDPDDFDDPDFFYSGEVQYGTGGLKGVVTYVTYAIDYYNSGESFFFQLEFGNRSGGLEVIDAGVEVTAPGQVKIIAMSGGEIGRGICATRYVGRTNPKLITDLNNCSIVMTYGDRKVMLWLTRIIQPRMGLASTVIRAGIEHASNSGSEWQPIKWLGHTTQSRYLDITAVPDIVCDRSSRFSCGD